MTSHLPGKRCSIFIVFSILFVVFTFSCSDDLDILSDSIDSNSPNGIGVEDKEVKTEETPGTPPIIEDSIAAGFESRSTLFPIQKDAYLQNGKGFNETIVRLEKDNRTAYLMFDLSAIDSIGAQITGATLEFTVTADEGDGEVVVYKGISTSWNESTLSSQSIPELDTELGRITAEYKIGNVKSIVLDVSKIAPEKLSLILFHKTGDDFAIAAKEHGSKPGARLKLTYTAPEDSPLIVPTLPVEEIPDVPTPTSPTTPGSGTDSATQPPAIPVIENETPVAKVSANRTSGIVPLTVSFTGNLSTDDKAITSYLWDFKDGSTAGTANAQHTFNQVGTYAVLLRVTDAEGLVDTEAITITVLAQNNAPTAVAKASVTEGPAPLQVSFNGADSMDDKAIVSYLWNFEGFSGSTSMNTSRTFESPGTYQVQLTVKDAEGLSHTASLSITVTEAVAPPPVSPSGSYPPGAVLASSFGYNSSDATDAFTKAINSSNSVIVIDRQASDWIIKPTRFFRIENKTIIFDDGVIIRAKSGAFPGDGDRMIEFVGAKNLRLEGNGATLAMRKSEYTSGESRHALSLQGCDGVTVLNLIIRDSGGDGIYIAGSSAINYSNNITLEDIQSINNRRQGMSIISAQNVWVRRSTFTETKGTLPEAGVDLEPNHPTERLVNINFSNCNFTNNRHAGFFLSLSKLNSSSLPISVTVENSTFRNNGSKLNAYVESEIVMSTDLQQPVKGNAVFNNITFDGSDWGVLFSKKPADSFLATFNNCTAKNITRQGSYPPIHLEASSNSGATLGGFVFNNFYLEYTANKPFIAMTGPGATVNSIRNITGTFTIKEPYDNPPYYQGFKQSNNVNVNIQYTHID